MYDALTLAAIADELATTIVGGRIQRVHHVDALTLAFEIYAQRQRRWLTISAVSEDPRILMGDDRPPQDPEAVSPMLLLLRKYAVGARIITVHQPPYERIIRITLTRSEYQDDEDELPTTLVNDLVIELMGRHSNIILVDVTGRIREAVKRVTPSMSRVRTVLPGQPYVPPPPQDKRDPANAGPSEILKLAETDASRLDRWLVASYLGFSPLLAKEVLARSNIDQGVEPRDLSVAQAEALLRAMHEVLSPLDTGGWTPRLYHHDGGATFSAIPLAHVEARDDVVIETPPSILTAAVLAHHAGAPLTREMDRHAPRRRRLLTEIESARAKIERRIRSLKRQVEETNTPDQLRLNGEMIYAYLWMIEPAMSELVIPDGLRIALDPSLSPAENAQSYFERYRKAQSARNEIPRRLEAARRQLAYFDQLALAAEQAESYDEIESVRLEWQEFAANTPGIGVALHPGGSKPAASARRPRRLDLDSGATIWVGRTGKQNDGVTFDIGRADDLWLHAREMPGAHVILRAAPGKIASEEDIHLAASVAAHYSAGRGATRVPVDVTERRHVRKIRGAGPGMVTYREEYTVDVKPQSLPRTNLKAAEA